MVNSIKHDASCLRLIFKMHVGISRLRTSALPGCRRLRPWQEDRVRLWSEVHLPECRFLSLLSPQAETQLLGILLFLT